MDEGRFRRVEEALWRSVGVQPSEHWVTLASTGTRVRLLSCGDGPPVLFVHGASNGASSWANLAALLPGFRCLLLDRPGCGLSEPSGRRISSAAALGEFADRLVVDVLDGLGLEHASLVGTSMGGYFVLRAAAAHPERVDRMVSLSWNLGAPIEKVPVSMRFAGVRAVGRLMTAIPPTRASTRMILRQIGLRNALETGGFSDEALDWFVSVLRDTHTMRNELDAAPALVRPLRGFDDTLVLADDVLRRIQAPTYVLWGEDDPQGGASTARAFVGRIPGAVLELMPNAGHAPWMDDAPAVAQRVQRHLAH